MTRGQFEHTIRAAGAILGVSDVLVIGSQAVHGSLKDALPIEATRSVEVDVAVVSLHNAPIVDSLTSRCATARPR